MSEISYQEIIIKDGEVTEVPEEGCFTILYPRKRKEWIVDGKYHRVDGPAVITDKETEWWINGKRHRIDGPAIKFQDSGEKRWWIDNIEYSEEEWKEAKERII